jgi:hypothetical protein
MQDNAELNQSKHPPGLPFLQGSVPLIILIPILMLVVVLRATQGALGDPWSSTAYPMMPVVGLTILVAVVFIVASAVLVLLLLRNRCTDRKTAITWLLLAIPLGISAPLALIATLPKLILENCPVCDHKRRIDKDKCEYCRCDWEPSPGQGIDIIEEQHTTRVTVEQ